MRGASARRRARVRSHETSYQSQACLAPAPVGRFLTCPMALFGRPTEGDDARAAAYGEWVRRRNPLAIASFVLGLFSLIEFGALVVPGVAGAVLGIVALVQLRRVRREAAADGAGSTGGAGDATDDVRQPPTPSPWTHGDRLAWGGIVMSVLSLVVAAVLYAQPWKG